jgi:hypothetical protein
MRRTSVHLSQFVEPMPSLEDSNERGIGKDHPFAPAYVGVKPAGLRRRLAGQMPPKTYQTVENLQSAVLSLQPMLLLFDPLEQLVVPQGSRQ